MSEYATPSGDSDGTVTSGTPEAIIEGMFQEAERLGHSPYSSQHALSFFVEEIDGLRARIAKLEQRLRMNGIQISEEG